MPLKEPKHATAQELRAFKKLPMPDQLLEIWLNGRETNGSVAELKARVDIIEPRVDDLYELEHDTNVIVRFVKIAGGYGNALLLAMAALIATFEGWQLWVH